MGAAATHRWPRTKKVVAVSGRGMAGRCDGTALTLLRNLPRKSHERAFLFPPL